MTIVIFNKECDSFLRCEPFRLAAGGKRARTTRSSGRQRQRSDPASEPPLPAFAGPAVSAFTADCGFRIISANIIRAPTARPVEYRSGHRLWRPHGLLHGASRVLWGSFTRIW